MKYTSILQVPSSKNSRLLRAIAKIEPRLAKSTGYHVKLTEKGGRPLSKCFSRGLSDEKCFRDDCLPCANPNIKGPSLCSVKSVVYECVCVICDNKYSATPSGGHGGRYVGQTSRTLYERAGEHMAGLRRSDLSNFLFKHWATAHMDQIECPEFRFRVVRCHKSPLDRMIHEAVRIIDCASMNSKSERGGIRLPGFLLSPANGMQRKGLKRQRKCPR